MISFFTLLSYLFLYIYIYFELGRRLTFGGERLGERMSLLKCRFVVQIRFTELLVFLLRCRDTEFIVVSVPMWGSSFVSLGER